MLPIEYSFKKLFHLRFLQEAKISFKKRDVSPKSKIVCCILAQTFNMKKLLLLTTVIVFAFIASGYAPTIHSKNSFVFPMSLQEFLTLTPHKYHELTGKKITLKEKIFLKILQIKLKKRLFDNKAVFHNPNEKSTSKFPYGAISLVSGIAAVIIILIAIWSIIPYFLAAAAIVFGLVGLKKNKKDIASLIGLILGGAFYLLVLLGLIFLDRLK